MRTSPPFEKTVALLFGGRSSEHEISLRSAIYVFKNTPEKYNIIPVGISRNGTCRSLTGVFTKNDFQTLTTENLAEIIDGKVPSQFAKSQNLPSVFLPFRKETLLPEQTSPCFWRILNTEASCIFPVLHGQNGEDGRLQGLFELAEIAYVGCDLRSSVVGIDKHIQKRLAHDAGIPVAKYEVVELEEMTTQEEKVLDRIQNKLGYPCFVKPNAMGSAVGADKVKNRTDLKKALKSALVFDSKALVEELVLGTEIECAFLGSSTNPRITIAGEIENQDFYSYDEKYGAQSKTNHYIPARLSKKRMEEVQKLAHEVAAITGISGLCRIDFWNVKGKDSFLFNEINTLPGLTSISMFPKLWEEEGVLGPQWIEELIERAVERKKILDKSQYGHKAEI